MRYVPSKILFNFDENTFVRLKNTRGKNSISNGTEMSDLASSLFDKGTFIPQNHYQHLIWGKI